MNITINTPLTRLYTDERGNRQVVHFTLTDDAAVAYRMVDDLPATVDAQTYLDTNIEAECLFVRRAKYPQRPVFVLAEGQTELQAFEAWITEESPIKAAWIDRWDDTGAAKAQSMATNLPSWAAIETAIDATTTIMALKVIVKKMARAQYWTVKGTET